MAYNDQVVIKVVLVEGVIGDWAAYAGPGEWSDERVRDGGNKLPEAAARKIAFLGQHDEWTTKQYRE